MKKILRVTICTDADEEARVINVEVDVDEDATNIEYSEVELLDIPTEQEEAELQNLVNKYAVDDLEDMLYDELYTESLAEVSPKHYVEMTIGDDWVEVNDVLNEEQYKQWCFLWMEAEKRYSADLELLSKYTDERGREAYTNLKYALKDTIQFHRAIFCTEYVSKFLGHNIENYNISYPSDKMEYNAIQNALESIGLSLYTESKSSSYAPRAYKYNISIIDIWNRMNGYKLFKQGTDERTILDNSRYIILSIPVGSKTLYVLFNKDWNDKKSFSEVYTKLVHN